MISQWGPYIKVHRPTLPCSFPHSTISEERLNFGVRDGIRWNTLSIDTPNFLNWGIFEQSFQFTSTAFAADSQINSYLIYFIQSLRMNFSCRLPFFVTKWFKIICCFDYFLMISHDFRIVCLLEIPVFSLLLWSCDHNKKSKTEINSDILWPSHTAY